MAYLLLVSIVTLFSWAAFKCPICYHHQAVSPRSLSCNQLSVYPADPRCLFIRLVCCLLLVHVCQEPPATMANHMFVLQPLEPVQVDKITVKLYPVVNSTMKPPEHAHAFQMNKAALTMPGIDRHMMLDTLGAQLNLSTIVDGILGNWNHHFCCNWCNFANLTILSISQQRWHTGKQHHHCHHFGRPVACHQRRHHCLPEAAYTLFLCPNELGLCKPHHLGSSKGDCSASRVLH
jgi:hypothetical protein